MNILSNDQEIDVPLRREEGTRPKKSVQIAPSFSLDEIEEHFHTNRDNIDQMFVVAESFSSEGKSTLAQEMWRYQIVLMDSLIDHFMHEITKYGMGKIFNKEWAANNDYKETKIQIECLHECLESQENSNAIFLEYINDIFRKYTFMNYKQIIKQFSLLNLDKNKIANESFPESAQNTDPNRALAEFLKVLYERRNQIAHQADFKAQTHEKEEIEKEFVRDMFDKTKRFVEAVINNIKEKDTME